MPLASTRAADLRPWLEYAIGAFGSDRCMFASNFPVDSAAGSFDDLYGAFDEITSGLDDSSRDALFAGTAERVYRL
jgi:predicted TIM-barrel fold metal-dependent hydrolase